MDLFVTLQTIFIMMAVNLRMQQCSVPDVFPPSHVTLYNDSSQKRLFLEWNVSHRAYELELNMLFQIEISRTENMTSIWMGNYSTTLTKSHTQLKWSWTSDLPLECVSHSVRLRSAINDERFPGINAWSDWSQWQTVSGRDTADSKLPYIFPLDTTVEKGSNVSFCCIAGKGQRVLEISYNGRHYPLLNMNNRSTVITVENVALSSTYGSNAVCTLSPKAHCGTVLFVSKPPDQPKSLSCETRDLKVLKCSWLPGEHANLFGDRATTYKLSEWFSQRIVNCSSNASSNWSIDRDQHLYNFTLTAENGLGKREARIILEVAHKVHPLSPTELSADIKNATGILLQWSMRSNYIALKLMCQTEVHKNNDGKVKLHNLTTEKNASKARCSIAIDGVQPYTNYTLRTRCCAAAHFWKWSEWSERLIVRTGEAAPTVGPDIWRQVHQVSDKRKVILYWRPLSNFQANGEIISYNITCETLDATSQPEHTSSPASMNLTSIWIGTRSYRITMTASNAVNSSPPSEMRIAGVTEDGQNEDDIKDERVSGTGDGIHISWKSDPRATGGYVVDWCNFPSTQHCDFQWKKYPPDTSSDILKSASFQPGIRYRFRVYGSYVDGARLLEKKTGYTRELAPTIKHTVSIVNIHPNSLNLTWDQYPTNGSQPGFFSAYYVYVKNLQEACSLEGSETRVLPDGSTVCKFTIGHPEENTFTVEHLKPNTKYSLAVVAVTAGGESPIYFVTEGKTHIDSQAVILAILLPVIMSSVLALMLLAVCGWKRKWLKEQLYPEIPDPNKSSVVIPNKMKGSYGREVLTIEDCNSQTLEVLKIGGDEEKQQCCNGQSFIEREKTNNDLFIEQNMRLQSTDNMEKSTSAYYLSLQNRNGEFRPGSPGTDPETNFENLTYMSPVKVGTKHILLEQMTSEINSNQNPTGLLYQPQSQIQPYSEPMDEDYCRMSPTHPASSGKHSQYLAQPQVPSSTFWSNELPDSTDPEECLSYKEQAEFNLELVNTVTFQDSMHSAEVSPTSTHSTVFLL